MAEHGCGSTNHGFWCSGVSTIFRSIHPNRRLIAATCLNAEVHVLDAGHFALDTAADEIAAFVRAFMR